MLATWVSEELGDPQEGFALLTIRRESSPSTPSSWKRVRDYKTGCYTTARYDHRPPAETASATLGIRGYKGKMESDC